MRFKALHLIRRQRLTDQVPNARRKGISRSRQKTVPGVRPVLIDYLPLHIQVYLPESGLLRHVEKVAIVEVEHGGLRSQGPEGNQTITGPDVEQHITRTSPRSIQDTRPKALQLGEHPLSQVRVSAVTSLEEPLRPMITDLASMMDGLLAHRSHVSRPQGNARVTRKRRRLAPAVRPNDHDNYDAPVRTPRSRSQRR